MQRRHLAAAALGITLLLGACGSGSSDPTDAKASTASTPTSAAEATPVTTSVSGRGPAVTVRTDDLDAQLSSVDGELNGAQDAVNQSNDTSPDRADD
jgi:hypothetical protein